MGTEVACMRDLHLHQTVHQQRTNHHVHRIHPEILRKQNRHCKGTKNKSNFTMTFALFGRHTFFGQKLNGHNLTVLRNKLSAWKMVNESSIRYCWKSSSRIIQIRADSTISVDPMNIAHDTENSSSSALIFSVHLKWPGL